MPASLLDHRAQNVPKSRSVILLTTLKKRVVAHLAACVIGSSDAHKACFFPSQPRTMGRRCLAAFLLLSRVASCLGLAANINNNNSPSCYDFVILGGTGRIGTAVASHLLRQSPDSIIVLVGRRKEQGTAAVAEVLGSMKQEQEDASSGSSSSRVSWEYVSDCWDVENAKLQQLVKRTDCLIHTAGPYLGRNPTPLQLAISSANCKAYVDVSDPLDFLDESLKLSDLAQKTGTTAVLAAGAFPGMSNTLAMEAASHIGLEKENAVQDVRFNYFTAGLGGSGDVNLYITNLGFGEPMAQYEQGKLRYYQALSGRLLGKVDFFLNDKIGKNKNELDVEKCVGRQTVFSWPFPEAASVARELNILGDSSAAMGTAPDVWNTMLGILVSVIPRHLWKNKRFSKFMADFSQPLVKATDAFLRLTSSDKVGETHAMRIDVTGNDGSAVSIVQAHESFRQCVGQSCAEFALDVLRHPSPGVQLPEQRYRNNDARRRIIDKLTKTPGTFCYTGPIKIKTKNGAPAPSDLERALKLANEEEDTK